MLKVLSWKYEGFVGGSQIGEAGGRGLRVGMWRLCVGDENNEEGDEEEEEEERKGEEEEEG